MEELKQRILESWLEIEYYTIANKAKFINKKVEVTEELILKSIRCIDYVSVFEKNEYRNYIITIVALMWEYIDKDKYSIRDFIIKILSRIGYPTSAIIIDEEYKKSECKFFGPKSIFDKITLTLDQSFNEIHVKGKEFLLTKFQMEIWEKMDYAKVIGISAPTSAGKSFVLLIKTISKMIESNLDIVYIVPTLSLLNQVTEDYNKMLRLLNIDNYRITNSFEKNKLDDFNYIYVLTQEKALSAFSNEEKAFNKDMILVVDEIQNIERILDENHLRSKILYDTLIEFRRNKKIEQIIICGPRIDDIDKLGEKIFGTYVEVISTTISPVLNLTYSIRNINNKYYFRQYCSLRELVYEREIESCHKIKDYGESRYSDDYLDYLKEFVFNIGKGEQNIIFAPTARIASKIACSFVREYGINVDSDSLNDLILYYKKTVNANYSMCNVLKVGVAYHHGKLPMHVRRTLEKAISKKIINNVICTTTLMQGVNMPAQNVIIRNPHLYTRKQRHSKELTSYEMSNLRGRSGRLLKDFIGRTYVLDESGFEEIDSYEQGNLFEDVSTELPVGYGERFEEFKYEIIDVVQGNKTVDDTMERYGYLVSYIRQTVLRYGKDAQKRMLEVGIDINKSQINTIRRKINKLTVPKEVCYKNRYWDPFVLDYIYKQFDGKIPEWPKERGARARINELLKFLRDNEPTTMMYERHIPPEYRRGPARRKLYNLCIDWACEMPLSEIIEKHINEDEEISSKIDDIIDVLERVVSFDVPLLLKPIFDMFNTESIFLTCIQGGAYKTYTRKMIEIGVPRETAIFLSNYIFKSSKLSDDSEKIDEEIRSIIKKQFDDLPYWIQVQLEFMK